MYICVFAVGTGCSSDSQRGLWSLKLLPWRFILQQCRSPKGQMHQVVSSLHICQAAKGRGVPGRESSTVSLVTSCAALISQHQACLLWKTLTSLSSCRLCSNCAAWTLFHPFTLWLFVCTFFSLLVCEFSEVRLTFHVCITLYCNQHIPVSSQWMDGQKDRQMEPVLSLLVLHRYTSVPYQISHVLNSGLRLMARPEVAEC